MLITTEKLKALYPKANIELLDCIANQYTELFDKYEITTPNRINYLLAQVGHESAGYTTFTENLNYSPKRLIQVWPNRFKNLNTANKYGRNPEALANNVYANRMGNGSESSGDGWKYRGRGPIQLTGKDAYLKISDIIGYDFINSPNDLLKPEYLFESVCAVWKWKNLNQICDSGNYTLVTKAINGGVHGLEDRKQWLVKVINKINLENKTIQKKLNITADGKIGKNSLKAIEQFKNDNNITREIDFLNKLFE